MVAFWASPANINNYMVPVSQNKSRAGGSFGSGSNASRSRLIGRAIAGAAGSPDIPVMFANTLEDLKNLGNTFYSKAVMNGVPIKNRASYIPPIGVDSSGAKLLMSGDNPDNPAQSSIIYSYVNDFTPYGKLDFRGRTHNNGQRAPFVRPFRAPFVRPFRGDASKRLRTDFSAPSRPTSGVLRSRDFHSPYYLPYKAAIRQLAADSVLSSAKTPKVNNVQPLALPLESKLMYSKFPFQYVGPTKKLPVHTPHTRSRGGEMFSRQNRELRDMLSPRGGILGFLGGLIGGFSPPTTTNTSISYTTSVSDQQAFKSSVSSLNQTINQYILNQTMSTSSEISNLANITLVDLSGENVDLNISNSQNITYINMTKLDVTATNQFVLTQATQVFNNILSAFKSENTASLTTLATAQNNSNLIDSILGAPKQTDNINNTITLNTSVQTAFDAETNAVYQNIANNSTVETFAQNFLQQLNNTFNLNVSQVSASKNLSILVNNTQAINTTLDIITKLDLTTATFNTINTSDTFRVDKSVTASTSAVASATTSTSNSSETVGSAIKSVGEAASSIFSGITLSIVGPIVAGAAVIAIGGATIYMLQRKRAGTADAARGDDEAEDQNFYDV